jgi:hypothetical protein
VFTRKAIRDNNQQEKAMRHAHATKPAPLPDDGLPGLPVLDVVDGVPTTTSFTVAEHFKKRHDKFRLLNFKETSFVINMPNGGTREDARFMQIYKMLVQLLPPGLPAREDMTEEDELSTDWPQVEAAYAQLMDIQEECQWRCRLVDDLMDRVELKLTNLEQARALIDEISRKRIKDK